jgi:carboxymethylenebutenolidase
MFRYVARLFSFFILSGFAVGLCAADAPQAASATVSGKRVVLTTAYGTTLDAYVAGPEDARRGILILHDRRGLGDYAKGWVDRFAGLGYRALAVDLYDGRYSNDPALATQIMTSVDQESVNADLSAGLDYLKAPGRKLATLGWDYGGGQALWATLQDPGAVSATVIYYGPLITDLTRLRTLQGGGVLGIFAKRDAWIAPAKVTAFEDALREAGTAPLTIMQYDADHGFANPATRAYDSRLADEAWRKTEEFLARHLVD